MGILVRIRVRVRVTCFFYPEENIENYTLCFCQLTDEKCGGSARQTEGSCGKNTNEPSQRPVQSRGPVWDSFMTYFTGYSNKIRKTWAPREHSMALVSDEGNYKIKENVK